MSGPSQVGSAGLATIEFKAGTVVLVSAPTPASVLRVSECATVCTSPDPEFHFKFTPRESVTFLALAIDFFDAAGRSCGYAASDWKPVPSTGPFDVHIKGVTLHSCDYEGSFVPSHTEVRLLDSAAGNPGQMSESANIVLPYSFSGPALSSVSTAPIVLSIGWDDNAGPTGGGKPLPGDFASYSCLANDLDGDALRVELQFRDVGGRCPKSACWVESSQTPPRSFPRAVSASVRHTHPADPFGLGFDLTCTVTDPLGFKASLVEHFK